MVVPDAIAIGWDAEARHALQKTCGEPAETAIAQRRIRLGKAHPVEIHPQIVQRPVHDVGHPQIAGDVVQ